MSELLVGTPHREPTGTRSAMLEEAIRVIDEHGEAAVRVRDIVAAVGVATTSLYHFFGSREDLLDAANAERYRRTLYGPNYETFANVVNECDTKDKLKAALLQGLDIERNPVGVGHRRIRVMVLGSAQSRPNLARYITEVNAGYVQQTAGLFQHAVEMGWTRDGFDPEAGALWYLGQMTGRVLLDMGGLSVDDQRWWTVEARAMVAMIFGDVD